MKFIFLIFLLVTGLSFSTQSFADARKRLRTTLDAFLDYNINYRFGGKSIKGRTQCANCTKCKREKRNNCQACRECGVDCSGYVFQVFKHSGLKYQYLSSSDYLKVPDSTLQKEYFMVRITDQNYQFGDILVFKNHLAMVDRYHKSTGLFDIFHATNSRAFPGEGVRHDKNVKLFEYFGKLYKVFRHKRLISGTLD